jgi:hypothetical protein
MSIAALAAAAFMFGACAAEQPTVAGNWSYPGAEAPTTYSPRMRLAALPVNPAPRAAVEDYADEPTRFAFRPRIIILEDGTEVMEEDMGAADAGEMDAGGDAGE